MNNQQKTHTRTIQAIRAVVDDLRDPTKRYRVATFLMDIKRAFDRVWWPDVMAILKAKNVPGSLIKTVISYLNDRRVKLKIGRQVCINKTLTRAQSWNRIYGSYSSR